MLKRPAFYIDLGSCTGCKTCMIACIDKHDLPERVYYRRVVEYTGGEWVKNSNDTYEQSVFAYYLSIACNHCKDPELCLEIGGNVGRMLADIIKIA